MSTIREKTAARLGRIKAFNKRARDYQAARDQAVEQVLNSDPLFVQLRNKMDAIAAVNAPAIKELQAKINVLKVKITDMEDETRYLERKIDRLGAKSNAALYRVQKRNRKLDSELTAIIAAALAKVDAEYADVTDLCCSTHWTAKESVNVQSIAQQGEV